MANWYVSWAAQQNVSVWTALATLTVGTFRRQTAPTAGNERVFVVTSITTGITGASEPTWSLNNNATTTDSGVTWTQVSGQESRQSAGNWTAPIARLTMLPNGSNAIGGASYVASGDTIFVSSDHAEPMTSTTGATLSFISGQTNTRILSVSRLGASLPPTSTDLTRGAKVTQATAGTTLTIVGGMCYCWGVDFLSAGAFVVENNGFESSLFDNCSFQCTRNSADVINLNQNGSLGAILWNNTPVTFANSGSGITLNGSQFEWTNTVSATLGTVPTNLFTISTTAARISIRGVDLSAVTTNLFTGTNKLGCDLQMRDCRLNSGVAIFNTANSGWNVAGNGTSQLMVDNCDDSTNQRNYRMFRSNCWGAFQQNIAIVRTGGNTDGTTSFSWQTILSQAPTQPSTFGNPARFPEIAQRFNTTGVSKVLTLYGITSFASMPTNANLWIDVEYLGAATHPLASFASSRAADALAAGSNLPADTSSWNSAVTTRQNSHSYAVGDLIKVTDNTANCTFICTAAGTSAGSEPGGYAAAVDGGAVTDSGATFRAMWRFAIASAAFTPNMAGTIKCTAKTLLGATSMTPTVNLLLIDPTFTIA